MMFGLPVAAGLDSALLAEVVDAPGDPAVTVAEAPAEGLADVAVGAPGGGLTEGAEDGGFADAGGTGLGDPGVDGLDVQPASKIANVAAITAILAR